jgi:hypothetical protein
MNSQPTLNARLCAHIDNASSPRTAYRAIRTLLEAGADPDTPLYRMAHKNIAPLTGMVSALSRGNFKLAELFLAHGANPNYGSDEGGHGALALACCRRGEGSIRFAKRLLDAGASLEAHNRIKATPLFAAVESGRPQLVKILLERGAQVNAVGARGENALHAACRYLSGRSTVTIIKMLVRHGVNVNKRSHHGELPLWLVVDSVRTTDPQVVQTTDRIAAILVAAGAILQKPEVEESFHDAIFFLHSDLLPSLAKERGLRKTLKQFELIRNRPPR